MKYCDVDFYEELIKDKKRVRVHLKGPKDPREGVITKESERVIILVATDVSTRESHRHMIYKGAIMEVEEI